VGANVILKGAKNGTTTKADGSFTISAPAAGKVEVVISHKGFTSVTTVVDNDKPVTVQLEKEISSLDDVVVIGYGTARKKDLTGAVSSIGADQLSKIPVSSAAEAITGRLAGVQVTSVDGSPGAEIVIRVRGGGSVTQDNSPLYIVDGFPVNSINDIAPGDIASIDILKDAASSAIYGAKGANGVVIVTTKSAKGGRTVINYSGFAQVRTLPKELKVLSPYEFVLAQYEYAKLRNDTTDFTKYFGVYDDLKLYKNQKGTDWQHDLFGKPIVSQQHNLSITGGTDRTKVGFSISENKDQGLMPGSGYERQYINFKLNHEVSKAIRLDLNARFTNTVTNGAGTSGASSLRVGDAITTRPVNGLADHIDINDATAGVGDDYDQFLKSLLNPIQLAAQDYRNLVYKTLNLSTGANWTILPGLVARSEFSYDLSYQTLKRYYGPLTSESKNVGGNLPLGELTNTNGIRFRWANTLNYNFKIGANHSLNFLVGQEVNKATGFVEYNRAKYFTIATTPQALFANMQNGTADGHTTRVVDGENMTSFFGRGFYSLMDKYLLTVTARADASSRFAPGHRWGVFPAMSAAWRISKEHFMDKVGFVQDLKLRASWGQAGNNRIADNLWRQIWSNSVTRTYGWGDVSNTYETPYNTSGTLPNPNIKWETTVTRNGGLDFTVLNGRLNGSLEVYWNTTKNLLVQQAIPPYTGYTNQIVNIGQTSNRGVELTLNAVLVSKKDFSLSATFNVGTNKSKIDDLGGVNSYPVTSNWASTDLKSSDDYLFQVGKSVGLIYGYVSDGFYTTDDFDSYDPATKKYLLKKGVADDAGILGTPSGYFSSSQPTKPGNMKLKDLSGDGLVTADKDRQIIGNALPKAQGGFGLNSTWKGFDASVFFNWVYGNDIYNTGKIAFNMYYRTTYGNMLNTVNYN
ncbi:MAG TPA: SusC/RagA family TonB-linked outer membrane protein, partial [Chitinophagaceae bacterium]|nr:SusC/RagA family TonB-linked outer membrane protein [Chitinophagaceae bacterium]